MANWVYNRPPVKCADSELEAARFMAKLDDGWWIRWGYYYKGDREGDFLVLGPAGGLLVLEIKSQLPHNIKGTGNWVFGDESADNPLAQLNAEWAGVIEDLKQAARGRQCPYVVKAIGLPNLNIAPDIAEYHGIKRQFILDQQQIAHLGAEWPSFFKAPMPPLTQDQRQVFLDAYCRESEPSNVRAFVDETDELILRHTQAEYELLDMLSGNRQLLVEGGPGSGKTWLALEQARRLAEEGKDGGRVLLLCYNLALCRLLEGFVAKIGLKRGSIEVFSWESLARELLGEAGLEWKPPEASEERQNYYDYVVPRLLHDIAHEKGFRPRYDALVVDEAQDHNTHQIGDGDRDTSGSWWQSYWRLLHDGAQAPMALFYDCSQRPGFRSGGFNPEQLQEELNGAVNIKLPYTVRYTRPIFNYLLQLECPATECLRQGLRAKAPLPAGPEVECQAVAAEAVADTVRDVVIRWVSEGWCRPHEILVLSPHGAKGRTSLAGCDRIGAWPLAEHGKVGPGQITLLSINKAKGLDARAVVVIDLPPFDRDGDQQDQLNHFMAASRARQLLTVLELRNGAK